MVQHDHRGRELQPVTLSPVASGCSAAIRHEEGGLVVDIEFHDDQARYRLRLCSGAELLFLERNAPGATGRRVDPRDHDLRLRGL